MEQKIVVYLCIADIPQKSGNWGSQILASLKGGNSSLSRACQWNGKSYPVYKNT